MSGKSTNICNLNNVFINNSWVKEGVAREIRKYFELNENKNITYYNSWGAAKGQIFMALNPYV